MRVAKLGEVAEFINGFPFAPDDWHSDGVPIIRIQNLTDPTKPLNLTRRAVPERYRVRSGDLLVSWSATLGVFTWSQSDHAVVNQHIFRVVPGAHVDRNFLRHMMAGALDAMGRHLHGATMKHVNRGEFLDTPIPMPTHDEQRRIAAILDQADALRAKRRQVLAHLDDLTQSIFRDMFDVARLPIRRFDEVVCDLEGGKSLVADDDAAKSAYRVLKISAVTTNRFRPDESKPLPVGYEPPQNHLVRHGDLLFSRANTTDLVGAVALVDGEPRGLALPDKLWRLVWRDAAEVDPVFVWALLQRPEIRRELSSLSSGTGGSMKNISKAKLNTLRLPWPSVRRQREFAAKVSAVRRHSGHASQLVERADQLFAALQVRAFRGEL